MRRTLTVVALIGTVASASSASHIAPGQEPARTPTKQPLRILFLGEPGSARSQAFHAFLADRFEAVQVAGRWDWDRALLEDADVVVLDWPQQDGVSKWMLGGDRTVEPRCPLGARDDWGKPTLLLGSAGLNVAWAWGVKGSFG